MGIQTRIDSRAQALAAAAHVQEVLLINTNGRESANAPYTRANAVVLPNGGANSGEGYNDEELLAHELFHVVSRYDPALATRLYATLGFEPAAPLQWPAQWLPLLVASRTQLGRSQGETFFTVLDIRLLEVLPGQGGAQTMPVLRGGQLVWHAPGEARDYLDSLGGNTSYIFHPEETMADNIAFLATDRKVPNPGLLKRIKAVLLGEAVP